ncbi:MAG: hypothetical protein KGI70_00750 [Patescibacteria group bacterium]|nr:hypothetical protein [Patescibacteria group bacterium]
MFKTSITSADPQGQQAVKVFEAVYNSLKLDETRAQNINESYELKTALQKALTDATGVYWSEHGYPKQYRGPRPLDEQIDALLKHFPALRVDETLLFMRNSLPKISPPFGAEGWFAIPRWEKVASEYGVAFNKLFSELVIKHKWKSHIDDRVGTKGRPVTPGKPNENMLGRFKRTIKGQTGDVVIVPAQFGWRHRGRSLVQAHRAMRRNEFGLGAFAVGCMLLTHHNRLIPDKSLQHLNTLICPGDFYRSGHDDGRVEDSPQFSRWHDGGISFWRHSTGVSGPDNTFVTAFVPAFD